MSRRTTVLAAMLAACVAAVAAVVVGLAASDGPAPGGLTDTGSHDAPRTAGTGWDGAPVAVPVAGRPAIVTFLFADCPDVCPRAAQEISLALDSVGEEVAGGIDVVAVSVDPEGDTPAEVRAFLDRHRLRGRMDYILGTRAELAPIWRAWAVAAQPRGKPVSAHSARIVLVDREGRQVGAYSAGVPVAVSDLATQMRSLVEE